jgi:hypothetical protein
VGPKTLVCGVGGEIVMKLFPPHQELLFEARPEVFRPFANAAMRWAFVDIGALDLDEAGELVREAWAQVVPKKVSKAYFAAD